MNCPMVGFCCSFCRRWKVGMRQHGEAAQGAHRLQPQPRAAFTPGHMPGPRPRTARHGEGNANQSLHGGKQNQSPGKAPDAPQMRGGLLQEKPWDYPRESCNDQGLRGGTEALRHSNLAQRLGSSQRHLLLQPPRTLAAPRHHGAATRCCCCGLCWGTYIAGDPLTHRWAGRSRVMSYLHASLAPASRPPVVERHVVAPRPAQRAADAERRHQLHCHRLQPTAGKAEKSASCLPASGPCQPAGWGLSQTAGTPQGICPEEAAPANSRAQWVWDWQEFVTLWHHAKGAPSPPQVPARPPHSPGVVEVEDKVRPWGCRKERCQSHVVP